MVILTTPQYYDVIVITGPPLELGDLANTGHSSSQGQPMGRHLFPLSGSDVFTGARVPPYHVDSVIKHESDASEYFEMQPVSIRGMAFARNNGAFYASNPEGRMALPQGDEWRKSSRIGHRVSSSTASSSTVEINDHIYQAIDQIEDEAYHSPAETPEDATTARNVCIRPRLLCRRSQSLRGPLVPENVAVKPKTPPPRLLNSPKSTASTKPSKLPLVPSSQSVRILSSTATPQVQSTAAERSKGSPPDTLTLDLKQTQHKAQSPETNDYVSLCGTPQTSTVITDVM